METVVPFGLNFLDSRRSITVKKMATVYSLTVQWSHVMAVTLYSIQLRDPVNTRVDMRADEIGTKMKSFPTVALLD